MHMEGQDSPNSGIEGWKKVDIDGSFAGKPFGLNNGDGRSIDILPMELDT